MAGPHAMPLISDGRSPPDRPDPGPQVAIETDRRLPVTGVTEMGDDCQVVIQFAAFYRLLSGHGLC